MTIGRDFVDGDDGTEPVAGAHVEPRGERGAPTSADVGSEEDVGADLGLDIGEGVGRDDYDELGAGD